MSQVCVDCGCAVRPERSFATGNTFWRTAATGRLHPCLDHLVAVVTVDGDRATITPEPAARPTVAEALAGRLTGPVAALGAVVARLGAAGIAVVLPAPAAVRMRLAAAGVQLRSREAEAAHERARLGGAVCGGE